MLGIYGVISQRPSEFCLKELELMKSCFAENSKFMTQELSLPENGVYIRWIWFKNSFSDCLPIENEKKDCILVYCGENFNDIELLDYLKRRNHIYDRKNASYLIHLYEEYGVEFFKILNGIYCGLLIDKREGKLYLFNDRYAIQKLYYYEAFESFYFSSNIKRFIKIMHGTAESDTQSIAELIQFNCILSNRSIIKRVLAIPSGYYFEFNKKGIIAQRKYFTTSVLESQTLLENNYFFEKMVHLIQKVLKRYFKSDERLILKIDSGIDIRIILANALFSTEKVKGYTIAGSFVSSKELSGAKEVAKIIGQDLHFINIQADFFQKFEYYAQNSISISNGTSDIDGSLDLYTHQLIRDIADIRVSADHGGAILRRNELMASNSFNNELFRIDFKREIEMAKNGRFEMLSSPTLSFQLNYGLPFTAHKRISIWQSEIIVRCPFLDNDIIDLMFRALDNLSENEEMSLKLIKGGNKNSSILHSSLQKHRRCIKDFNIISECFLKKRKTFEKNSNFFFLGEWYRKQLSKFIMDIMLDKRSLERAYINGSFLKKMIDNHMKGKNDFTIEISLALRMELINRTFFDN